MADKKLRVILELDDRAFVAGMKRVQELINKMNSGSMAQQGRITQYMQSQGMGGSTVGGGGQREQEQAQRKMSQESDKAFQESKRKIEILAKLRKSYNEEILRGVSDEKKGLEIAQKLADLQERELRTGRVLRLQVDRERAKSVSGGVAGIGGAITAGIGLTGAAIGAQGRLPIESAAAAGEAAASLVGNQLKEMSQPSHQAFLAERIKATGAARKAWQAGRTEDYLFAGAKVAATVVGLSAAAILAAPELAVAAGGTALAAGLSGASLAGIAGGITAGIGGAASIISSPKSMSILTGQNDAYEKLSSKDLAELNQQSIKAQEEADPLKKMAADYWDQNYQRNLGIQRGLGLSDQGFKGRQGFLQGNMGYGGGGMHFTEEQVTGEQQAIMAAGGSARMGREAGYGLQLQRDYNLTNSAQVLGSLSKTMGGAGETKEATARVMATAFKDGLNDSELVDLFRSFTGTAAQFIAAAGAKTAQDAARISDQFGKGLAENTGVGVEGAKNAYEAYKQLSGARSGTFAVLKRAAMMRDPKWSRLLSMGAEGSKIFEAAVGAEDPAVLRLAAESAAYKFNKGKKPGDTGYTTVESLMDSQSSNIGASGSLDSSIPGYRAIIRKWEQANGIPIGKALASGIPVPEDVRQAVVMAGQTLNTPGLGAYAGKLKTAQDIMAAGASFTSGDITHPNMVLGGGAGTGTKDADQTNAAVATTQQAFIDNWETFGKSLIPTAGDLAAVNKELILLGQIAADIKAGKRPDSDFSKGAAALGTQPQANSSSALPGAGNSFSYK